ncbi:hypothetical protein HPB52_004007 [Rhipicephalus sanguineus]|uniref:Nlr family card domain protein n=1 Tax=Rhipicephalus sanguineus TaxID=34632 RepID=A0A9D4PHR5_RHISA|nr:hypothetical protein HPB52_004007 [Rhipicephalus sanguineus]
MSLPKNCFNGSSINYPSPCTSSEGRLCEIFRDLPLWNEYFWRLGIELRKVSPGELSLVAANPTFVCWDSPERFREAATFLHILLTQHRCVTCVDVLVDKFWDHRQLICDALRESLNLRKLLLYGTFTDITPSRSIASALLHLNSLRELECKYIVFGHDFIEGLSEFLANTRSLTTLTMPDFSYEDEEDAVVFIQGLKRNKTLTTLSLNTSVLSPSKKRLTSLVLSRCAVSFADHLSENQTLRTLKVSISWACCFLAVHAMICALFGNKTLTKLSLVMFSLDDENIQHITRLLNQNRSLTSLNLNACLRRDEISRMDSFLVALTENETLEEVTLDSSLFKQHECRSFFKGLASNSSLKKVNVERLELEDMVDMFRVMQETGVEERFFVGTHHVLQDTIAALTECTFLSSVSLDSRSFRGLDPFFTALSLLPSCSHVTSLCLSLHENNGRVSSLIAQYITGTATLRKLDLFFFFIRSGDALDEATRELVHALSANKSIRWLRVSGFCFDATETQMMVDTLQSSRALCNVYLFQRNDESSNSSLIRKLSPTISSNYTLLSLSLDETCMLGNDWFTIDNVVCRNNSLVTRAADFVMGTRNKDYAAATELVRFNPGLVAKVQELATVDEHGAASRIKSSLESFSELDDFMRLAGVVKCSVSCHRRDGGQKQLVDLNRDCWLHLRQYIKVGDILDEL